jgi:hypothetical protein
MNDRAKSYDIGSMTACHRVCDLNEARASVFNRLLLENCPRSLSSKFQSPAFPSSPPTTTLQDLVEPHHNIIGCKVKASTSKGDHLSTKYVCRLCQGNQNWSTIFGCVAPGIDDLQKSHCARRYHFLIVHNRAWATVPLWNHPGRRQV